MLVSPDKSLVAAYANDTSADAKVPAANAKKHSFKKNRTLDTDSPIFSRSHVGCREFDFWAVVIFHFWGMYFFNFANASIFRPISYRYDASVGTGFLVPCGKYFLFAAGDTVLSPWKDVFIAFPYCTNTVLSPRKRSL